VQKTNPGINHIHVGDIRVTSLNDGMFEASTDLVVGVSGAESEALLQAGFRCVPPDITVNAFLVISGDRTILIDTGCGNTFGPDMGHAARRLEFLGIEPEVIDTILLSHAHVDHLGGLLDGSGGPHFPKAELVLNRAEHAYWHDDAMLAAAAEERKGGFHLARKSIAAYDDRIRLVGDGETAASGITAVDLPGHTPGHTGWMIGSGKDALLIWGDIVHLPGIQFARPEAGMMFDVDIEKARATRAFDMAATDRLMVAGMHLDFPAFGHVARAATGYAFVPEVWSPTPR
jgi:glyoxylase-like metal-dependent hydrolase (beta-lactamase superfamily II)